MGKVPFSNKIDSSLAESFEKLSQILGFPKFRILESAIEVFSVLHREIQRALCGNDPAERELCLKMLTNLSPVINEKSSINEYIEKVRDVGTRYKIPGKAQQELINSLRKSLGLDQEDPASVVARIDAAAKADAKRLDRRGHGS